MRSPLRDFDCSLCKVGGIYLTSHAGDGQPPWMIRCSRCGREARITVEVLNEGLDPREASS